MAGDWIKVEHATLDKPEVLKTARMLGVKHGEALECYLRWWLWLDVNSVDGLVDGLVDEDVDRIVRMTGFAACMRAVGWLVDLPDGPDGSPRRRVANFETHNGESAKKRALRNRAQSKWRSGVDGSVDGPVDRNVDGERSTNLSTREEKRREEETHRPERKKPRSGIAGSTDESNKKGKGAKGALTFSQWATQERAAGRRLVPKDHPVFTFAEQAGIPRDFVAIAWSRFKEIHDAGGTGQRKRQASWPATFANAVKDNWGGLWRFDVESGACVLTGAGEARRRAMEAESEAAQRELTNGSATEPAAVT